MLNLVQKTKKPYLCLENHHYIPLTYAFGHSIAIVKALGPLIGYEGRLRMKNAIVGLEGR